VHHQIPAGVNHSFDVTGVLANFVYNTDASRSNWTVAEGIPEGFHLANSERVTAKAQERLATPSPSPHHLQLHLLSLQRLQHREENQLPVVIAQDRFRAAFRMRHHAQHIALGIDDPGNVIQ